MYGHIECIRALSKQSPESLEIRNIFGMGPWDCAATLQVREVFEEVENERT